MSSKSSGKNASERRTRAKLKRYTEFAGAACVGSCAVAAVLVPAWMYTTSFPILSQTVAAWVQAIGSPLAIAAAFLVARNQATEQARLAEVQREYEHSVAVAARNAEAKAARIVELRQSGSNLIVSHAVVGMAALAVANYLLFASKYPKHTVDQRTLDSFKFHFSMFADVNVAGLVGFDINATVLTARKVIADLLSEMRLAHLHKVPVSSERLLIPAQQTAFMTRKSAVLLENQIEKVSAQLLDLGAEGIEAERPVKKWPFGHDWGRFEQLLYR